MEDDDVDENSSLYVYIIQWLCNYIVITQW